MSTDGQEKRDARLTAALDGLHGGDGVQRGEGRRGPLACVARAVAKGLPCCPVWRKHARCVIELRRMACDARDDAFCCKALWLVKRVIFHGWH